MTVHVLERRQRLEVSPERAFAFFSDARNLETITPPWLRFHVLTPGTIEMRPGALIDYRLRLHGIPLTWRTRIAVWEPPRRFVDVQLRGPYALWEHTHTFEPAGAGGVVIRDRVRYALPFGRLGDLARRFVRRDLDRIFDHRMRAIAGRLA
jgi:ligand-binding SRPBCC domain-containing protein